MAIRFSDPTKYAQRMFEIAKTEALQVDDEVEIDEDLSAKMGRLICKQASSGSAKSIGVVVGVGTDSDVSMVRVLPLNDSAYTIIRNGSCLWENGEVA